MTFLLVLIYISFISLGLPDSLLGSAWPVMHTAFGVQTSFAGLLSMTVAAGTVVSSFLSARMIARFGTAKVTAVSVVMTGLALGGFAVSGQVWMLFLFAVPLGLGAGSVDAALNNFVALHFEAKHMNWLHCFWGIGTTVGPMIMAFWISSNGNWRGGYGTVAVFQCILAAVLFATIPCWKKIAGTENSGEEKIRSLSSKEILRIPLAKPMFLSLFCYCAIESTVGLWSASYAVALAGVSADTAAAWAAAFYFGITAGRAAAGFLSLKFGNLQMIRLGQALILLGVIFFAASGRYWADSHRVGDCRTGLRADLSGNAASNPENIRK